MKERHQANLHADLIDTLLLQNRQRCCVCRNPAKPVSVYPIDESRSRKVLDNHVVLCGDCYCLAIDCESAWSGEYLISELIRYKQIWERECLSWQNGPNYAIRIKQGGIIKDIRWDELDWYNCCGSCLAGRYYLDDGGQIHIDLTSDEIIKVDIRKSISGFQYGDVSYVKCEDGYEFNLQFAAKRGGWYALLIYILSSKKTTVELNVSTFLSVAQTQEADVRKLVSWAETQKEKAEKLAKDSLFLRRAFEEFYLQLEEAEKLAKDSATDVEYVPWKILPPGEHPFTQIMSYYESLGEQRKKIRYDLERLRQVSSLEPAKTYCGIDEFEGYVVFYFQELNIAILDCPIVGNAIYILLGDWQNLCRLSKGELLNFHPEETIRITHSGDWFDRLKEVFDKLKQAEKGCDFI